jgi:hypothetical protein
LDLDVIKLITYIQPHTPSLDFSDPRNSQYLPVLGM